LTTSILDDELMLDNLQLSKITPTEAFNRMFRGYKIKKAEPSPLKIEIKPKKEQVRSHFFKSQERDKAAFAGKRKMIETEFKYKPVYSVV
jgi:hypothetical protein